MGIAIEFNPELALRDTTAFRNGSRQEDECIPAVLEVGKIYPFRKTGQRMYYLEGEMPLIKTDGRKLSLPIASILILEARHAQEDGVTYTTGTYVVKEIFTDTEPHFNGFAKI